MVLSNEDFKTLLLIHLADCDYDLLKVEIAKIIQITNKQSYDKMIDVYQARKTESFNYLVKEFCKRFKTADERKMLYSDFQEVMQADNTVNEFESQFYSFFEKLNIHS